MLQPKFFHLYRDSEVSYGGVLRSKGVFTSLIRFFHLYRGGKVLYDGVERSISNGVLHPGQTSFTCIYVVSLGMVKKT